MPKPNQGAKLEFREERGVWEIIWFERGQRRRKGTGTAERAEADKIFGRWLLDKEQGEAGPCHPDKRRIADVLNGYSEEHAPDCRDSARIGYAIKALLTFWGDKFVGDITKQSCKAYGRHRQKADGTVRKELGTLAAAINHDVGEKRLSAPVTVFLPEKPDNKDRWLTREEAAQLLRAARKDKRSRLHLPLFILMGLYTAARKEAILSLRWPQVDFERGQIDFNPPGRKRTSKGRALIPIPRRLMTFLRLARKRSSETGFVIEYFGVSAKRLREAADPIHGRAVKNIKHAFASAAVNAGLGEWKIRVSQRTVARTKAGTERFPETDVTPHVLRHTSASWMAQARVPMEMIAQYLGHDDVRTTIKIYAHHHPDYLSEAAQALDGRR
ncbi:MAG: site-specific integrase [Telmatospirillum sp.]|nr:site-specific integrase [Telmatospirillum sp.]